MGLVKNVTGPSVGSYILTGNRHPGRRGVVSQGHRPIKYAATKNVKILKWICKVLCYSRVRIFLVFIFFLAKCLFLVICFIALWNMSRNVLIFVGFRPSHIISFV